jgi:DNA ligase-1
MPSLVTVLPLLKTTYGEVGGKLQETSDTIKEGKNVGKKNETSIFNQAVAEATSKWEKKLKAGYVLSQEDALSGVVHEIVEGGILPMLAHSYDKSGEKISYPCSGQPKLDGIRCIAIKNGNSVTLWSRTRKPITSCPHIIEAINKCFDGDIVLDGELYNHDLKEQFEKIVSAVRKEEPSEESLLVQYHIYDHAGPGPFLNRILDLGNWMESSSEYICIVPTYVVEDEIGVPELFKSCKSEGYEGAMLRNQHGLYENKRSYHLQKVKEFEDAEFEIVGVEEGRGKLQGLVGAFVCRTKDGTEFKAKPAGDQEATKTYLENPESVIGKLLTVQFQGLTGKNGVPRFPVGLRVREWDL